MKLIMAEILQGYEFSLLKPQGKRVMTWRSSIVPRLDTIVVFQSRGKGTERESKSKFTSLMSQ